MEDRGLMHKIDIDIETLKEIMTAKEFEDYKKYVAKRLLTPKKG